MEEKFKIVSLGGIEKRASVQIESCDYDVLSFVTRNQKTCKIGWKLKDKLRLEQNTRNMCSRDVTATFWQIIQVFFFFLPCSFRQTGLFFSSFF